MNIEQEMAPLEIALAAVSDLVTPEIADPSAVCRQIIEVLRKYGISEESASTCDSSAEVIGALEGLGFALTDSRCQSCLFGPTTRILEAAGSSLQIAFIVGFLEPFLRHPVDVMDSGFVNYMKWFLGLRSNDATRWAVIEAYEPYGDDRLKHDIELIESTEGPTQVSK